MTENQYYIRVRGKVMGPLTLDQLKNLRDRGQFRRFHEVSGDRRGWMPASLLTEIFPAVQEVKEAATESFSPSLIPVEPLRTSKIDDTVAPQAVAEWYYVDANERRHGPVFTEELIALLRNGSISDSTPVWRPGMKDWVDLSSPQTGIQLPLEHADRETAARLTDEAHGPCPPKRVDEKYCHECGARIRLKATICPKCGVKQVLTRNEPEEEETPSTNRIAAGVFGILLGALGIHKFILGYPLAGIIMLLVTVLTCGWGGILMGIIGLVEGIIYLSKSERDFYRTYVLHKRSWF
jgi:TM2 domain-containing membrane protein YozV/ribosomal protein L40E